MSLEVPRATLLAGMVPASAAPTTPTANDVYPDDGTNTDTGKPGMRYYTGAAWADVTGAETVLHGVGNRDSLTPSYDPATRVVTITGAAEIWVDGVLTTLATPYEFAAHANTTGTYYMYFNSNGTEVVSTAVWSIETDVPVAYVSYNLTLTDGFAYYELHSAESDRYWRRSHHLSIGALVQAGSGFDASGYTLDDDADASKTLAITGGTIWDEDIAFTIGNTADGGPYTIWSRGGASGVWAWDKTATFPFLDDGTDIEYNQFTGGAWQLTPLTDKQHMNMWVFATSAIDGDFDMFFVVGQSVYAKEKDAIAAPASGISWGTLPFQEIVPLYQITLKFANGNGGQGKAEIRAVTRLIGTQSSIMAGGASPTSAGAVSFVPAGAIAATDVQSAIEELDTEKVSAAAVIVEHSIVRGDGGANGVQDTSIVVDDSDNVSAVNGIGHTAEGSLTVASGAVTPTTAVAKLAGEGAAADDLTDISTFVGHLMIRNNGQTITLKDHGSDVADKIRTKDAGDKTLANNAWAHLYRQTTSDVWHEVG